MYLTILVYNPMQIININYPLYFADWLKYTILNNFYKKRDYPKTRQKLQILQKNYYDVFQIDLLYYPFSLCTYYINYNVI